MKNDSYIIPPKDRSRSEREKLKNLSFKEKIEYIWHYYNYHIIGTVVVSAFIISMVTTCVTRPDTGLFIAWENPYIYEENLEKIAVNLTERLFEKEDKTIAEVVKFYSITDEAVVSAPNYDRLIAMLTARAIDCFVLDIDTAGLYSGMEFLMPLEDILFDIFLLDPVVYDKVRLLTETLPYGSNPETAAEHITAIKITEIDLFKELSIPIYDDAYLSVAISASNRESIINLIIELFK